MGEAELLRQIQKVLSMKGLRVFRNQVGMAKVRGQYVTTGLGKGSSDIVGWRSLTITQEMVGSHVAQFVAVEVKDGESYDASPEQVEFLAEVKKAGGVSLLARRVEDVVGL